MDCRLSKRIVRPDPKKLLERMKRSKAEGHAASYTRRRAYQTSPAIADGISLRRLLPESLDFVSTRQRREYWLKWSHWMKKTPLPLGIDPVGTKTIKPDVGDPPYRMLGSSKTSDVRQPDTRLNEVVSTKSGRRASTLPSICSTAMLLEDQCHPKAAVDVWIVAVKDHEAEQRRYTKIPTLRYSDVDRWLPPNGQVIPGLVPGEVYSGRSSSNQAYSYVGPEHLPLTSAWKS
jgi:hypothetical protein